MTEQQKTQELTAAEKREQRRLETNAKIHRLANSSIAQFMQNVTCGFELETQSIGGYDYSNWRHEYAEDEFEEDMCFETWAGAVFEKDINSDKLEWGEDGSVEGIEIRTIGGLSVKEFAQAAKDTFKFVKNRECKVDEKCSFHIHIKVKDMKHRYSERFQRRLVEGVMLHAHLLDQEVYQRWRHEDCRRLQEYFNFEQDNHKYNFAHQHGGYGTWELRCFGNVTSYRSAMKCLQVAVLAMRHAYRARAKLEQDFMKDSNEYRNFWRSRFYDLLNTVERVEDFSVELNRAAYERAQELKRRKQKNKRKKA